MLYNQKINARTKVLINAETGQVGNGTGLVRLADLSGKRNEKIPNLCKFETWEKQERQTESALLLLIQQRRPTDALALEVETYLNMVGDGHERNALFHPIVLTVEHHFSFNLA